MDGYYEGGYDLPVPVGSECGNVCQKEEKFRRMMNGQQVFSYIKERQQKRNCRIDIALIRQLFCIYVIKNHAKGLFLCNKMWYTEHMHMIRFDGGFLYEKDRV